MFSIRRIKSHLAALLLSMTAVSGEAAFSNVFFFGDSLSDTGNGYTASGGTFPPSPYQDGRFSDGPLWVEYLASGLGLPAASDAWLKGGNNFAWAGAYSGADGAGGAGTGLLTQVFGQWPLISGGAADPDALYVLGIGANDLREAVGANAGMGADDIAFRNGIADAALGNLSFSLNALIAAGARNLLIPNVPDLGLTPEAALGGAAAASTQVSTYFNAILADSLETLRNSVFAPSVVELDFFGLLRAVHADALAGGGRFGLVNAVLPCFAPNAPSCDTSLFVDELHPTATLHALAGSLALEALGVPEPSVLLLVGLGLVLLGRRWRPGLQATPTQRC